ncbi:MAG: hypothetical protein WCY64_03685 [Candidatus Cloacimonadaceae bacterium]
MRKNKTLLITLLLIIILIAAGIGIWQILKGPQLNQPESIAFDADSGKFLISNVGNGSILAMDDNGKLEVIIDKGLDKPRGIKMLKKTLWVTDDTKIHAIDVAAKRIKTTIPIPQAKMLNDIEADELGILYISDTKANCLWIVDPFDRQFESVSHKLLQQPNGIYFDKPRQQMLIVSMGERQPIVAFNTKTREFDVFKDTLYSGLDGIQADDPGRIFFSSWEQKAIIMIPQTQNRFIHFHADLESPADIYWHEPTNELIVPLMKKNQIIRLPLDE